MKFADFIKYAQECESANQPIALSLVDQESMFPARITNQMTFASGTALFGFNSSRFAEDNSKRKLYLLKLKKVLLRPGEPETFTGLVTVERIEEFASYDKLGTAFDEEAKKAIEEQRRVE